MCGPRIRQADPVLETLETANSNEVRVNITVTDVNEAPTIAGRAGEAKVPFNEGTGDITTALDSYDWK